MSLETMTKLSTVTVGAGGSSTVSFTNIPQGYTDLKFIFSAQGTYASAAFDGVYLSFNGSTNNFTGKYTQAITPSTPTSGSLGRYVGAFPTTTLTNKFGSAELYVSEYSSNKYKMYTADAVTGGYSSNQALLEFINSIWSNPTPVTSVSFAFLSGNFAQYSTVTMYGIKNAARTAGNSVKATGGSVVFDGTYTYHVFSSTGTFTPTQTLTADYLVVAGGGGGGWGHAAGGGAGGLRSATNQTLAATAYSVTVGAGGSTGTNYGASSKGTNGSDSVFNLITSTGGGAGGGTANGANANGNSGGSGGGGSYSLSSGYGYAGTGNTPSTSPSQGNDGAQGGTGPASGGGGGGAGGAGVQGTPGSGGIGSSAFSQWGTATGQGHNISGTYYFAGGGGGGAENYNGAPGGFGGGGNGATSGGTGSAGMPNTGGGGGGGSYTSYPGTAGGAGASGVVIIRYKG